MRRRQSIDKPVIKVQISLTKQKKSSSFFTLPKIVAEKLYCATKLIQLEWYI